MIVSKREDHNNLVEAFSNVVLGISSLAKEIGINVRPYFNENLPFFSALKPKEKITALYAARSYLQICQKTKMGGTLSDAKLFTWQGIKSLGLRPSSDLFEYIENDHVIEIHDFSAKQLFRNLNYFRYSSYDLESLYCKDIQELFTYDDSTIAYLGKWFHQIETGTWNHMKPFKIPPYKIKESCSPFLS